MKICSILNNNIFFLLKKLKNKIIDLYSNYYTIIYINLLQMSSNKNYYEILGVSKDASEAEIKDQYKKQTRKFHPDRCPNPEKKEEYKKKFEEINEANSVLSDKEKREMYDRYGTDGVKQLEQHESQPDEDDDNTPPCRTTVEVSLDDLYNGAKVKCTVERRTSCEKCSGYGTKTATKETCKTCNGKGVVLMRMGPLMTQAECDGCRGTGIPKSVDKCKSCRGERFIKENAEVEIDIPKGAANNNTIRIENEGHQIPPENVYNHLHTRSDLFCTIVEKPHNVFKRGLEVYKQTDMRPPMAQSQTNSAESHLLTELDVTFAESICGFSKNIKHFGKNILVDTQEPIRHGDIFVIAGKGMPMLHSNEFGDLFVKMSVEHPKKCKFTKNLLAELNKMVHVPEKISGEKYNMITLEKYKNDNKIATESDAMRAEYNAKRQFRRGVGGMMGGDEQMPEGMPQCVQQ